MNPKINDEPSLNAKMGAPGSASYFKSKTLPGIKAVSIGDPDMTGVVKITLIVEPDTDTEDSRQKYLEECTPGLPVGMSLQVNVAKTIPDNI